MVVKNRSTSFGLAIRNNNVRAAMAVVSKDAPALLRMWFQPHLVLTIIAKNESCVNWFMDFLRALPDGRRDKLFSCTYKKCKDFKLLHDAGVPRSWIIPETLTKGQLLYLTHIGYVDLSPTGSDGVATSSTGRDCAASGFDGVVTPSGSDPSYVTPSSASENPPPSSEIPSSVFEIPTKSLSDVSPPATPGPESGIDVLSNVATSDELGCKQRPRRSRSANGRINVAPAPVPEQCSIM